MAAPRAEHINPFIRANIEAMETVVGIALTKTSLDLKQAEDTNSDISGVLGFAGDLAGSIVLNFPKRTACEVASRFLDLPVADLTPDATYDAVGELVSMIGRGAKHALSGSGVRFEIGQPCIVVGPNHKIFRGVDAPAICVGFETDVGTYTLEVCLQPSKR